MPDEVEPHIYASGTIDDEPLRENVLAFAERHGFSLAGLGSGDRARDAFQDALDHGVDVMINPSTGKVQDTTGEKLATDEDAMDDHLAALQDSIEVYAEYFPEGRAFLWHEAPLGGDWAGDVMEEQAENMLEYGPDIFAAQKEAVKEVAPDVDVGIFIHHPFMPSEEHTKRPYFQEIMAELEEKPGDALPDFTYCDFYRGYDEWEGGYEATNDYLIDVLENAKAATGGRPMHYLGEAHAINNNYCPSKQAILGNLRAGLDADVDGYGWYNRGSLRVPHDRTYNPFLPNSGEVEGDFDSVRGSRDRWKWAFLLLDDTLAGAREAERFDLWVHGEDFQHYEHRLYLERDGEWEFVGEFSGYLDGDNPYSGGGRESVAAFHALDRAYLEGGLDVRIETDADSDGATLKGLYAVPYAGAGHYRTEQEAADLVADGTAAAAALGHERGETTLSPGGTYTNSVAASGEATVGDTELAKPIDDIDRLADLEAEGTFDATDYFDLWVYGDGVADAAVHVDGEEITDRADAGGSGTGEALVVRGLSRDEQFSFHTAGDFLDLRVEAGDGTVRGAWVMPHHGTDNPKTPAEVAAIVEREESAGHDQLATFCLGTATAKTDAADGTFERWVQINERHICECDPYCDYHPSAPWPPWHEL
jgi:hypothetical protein